MASPEPKPRRPIRRFDVFAEYNRLERLERGLDEPHAKGYGLWVAKVVAKVVASGGGRRPGGRPAEPAGREDQPDQSQEELEAPERGGWHELSGEAQTDVLFDREIVDRMGADFYHRVFSPAIARAVRAGRSYGSIRDAIRKDWKPPR